MQWRQAKFVGRTNGLAAALIGEELDEVVVVVVELVSNGCMQAVRPSTTCDAQYRVDFLVCVAHGPDEVMVAQHESIEERCLAVKILFGQEAPFVLHQGLDKALDAAVWETEAARMSTVYSRALMTISVNDAKDAREGFFGPRGEMAHTSIVIPYATGPDLSSPSYVYARRKRIDIGAYIASTFKSAYTITEVVHTGEFGHQQRHKHFQPLIETHGWTFQERLLSPRTVHFTDYEMAFECRESLRCECSRVPVPNEYGSLFKVQTTNTVNQEKKLN